MILLPGTYMIGADPVEIQGPSLVHGQPGAPRPRIQGTGVTVVELTGFADDRLEDVEIVSTPPASNALVLIRGTVDRTLVLASGNSSFACVKPFVAFPPSELDSKQRLYRHGGPEHSHL